MLFNYRSFDIGDNSLNVKTYIFYKILKDKANNYNFLIWDFVIEPLISLV